jgi:hypothetical protein
MIEVFMGDQHRVGAGQGGALAEPARVDHQHRLTTVDT